MILPLRTYLDGISAIICTLVGVIYGIYFIYLYAKMKKPLMPWISLTAIAGGLLYLGPVASFLDLIITGQNLSASLYGQLSYTFAAIGTFSGMFAGFSIFNPKRRKLIVWIYGVVGIVYIFCLYVFPATMISGNTPKGGELMDVSLNSAVLVITAFYILSFVFIISVGFLRLSRKMKEHDEKIHAILLGIGWIIFAVSGTIDAIVPITLIHLIVIARILMVIAFILIYTGFAPPKKERKKF